MKKIAIIGGGITGCVSAIYYAKLGHKVEIYEKEKNLGGVINDLESNNTFFFNGPQYLEDNSWWVKLLKKDKLFNKIFCDFNLNYGSYNNLFGKEISSNNFAQIKTDIVFKYLNTNKIVSYKDRIECYQKNVSKPILDWSNRYCEASPDLHPNCSSLINTGRVFFFKDEKKIFNMKKNEKLADSLLGLPNKEYLNNKMNVPINGFKYFFNQLDKFLKNKEININYDSKIKIVFDKKISLSSNTKNINFDYAIWCANPVPLLKASNIGILDNPVVKVLVVGMQVKLNNEFIENLYVQVFSKTNNLFRIYIYKINNKVKLSLEIIAHKENKVSTEINFAIKVLKLYDITIDKYFDIVEKKEVRHMLYTVNDFKKFEEYEKKQSALKVISGGWHLIGREKKIEYIINNLDKNIKS